LITQSITVSYSRCMKGWMWLTKTTGVPSRIQPPIRFRQMGPCRRATLTPQLVGAPIEHTMRSNSAARSNRM
jgi:hypothetical protein